MEWCLRRTLSIFWTHESKHLHLFENSLSHYLPTPIYKPCKELHLPHCLCPLTSNSTALASTTPLEFPVEIHEEERVYVSELIFGHLLTSSNYDDTVKKAIGGRKGYGTKLTNIFSTEFIIETVNEMR
ncbi:hypothetical protein DVH24_000026 [Malus domestica]|uniref:DNA topoisomerase (ATP-hydrolyzing) n=1 Tax=Malus domestica TaxID=3750 RepID=A0A498J1J2_MALDO|nr:hypothetical protein DVH24_000026 [Malus domestica]